MKNISTPIKENGAKLAGDALGEGAVIPLQLFLPADLAKALLNNASNSNLSPENYVLFILDFHLGEGSLLDHFMNAPVSYE